MSSIYPEKIAMYFSSMNPLSAKIFADIKAVEDTVKIDNNLSFSEKSKIIDKHLIHDVIRRNKKKQQQQQQQHQSKQLEDEEGEDEDIPADQIYYDDPELDKDQVTALLTSVYPRKPEKYIYDDNSFYLDEHSEPFSYCSQSQTKFCDLDRLVKNLPLPSVPPTRKSDSKSRSMSSHHAPHHHHHHHHREKKQAPLPITTRRLSDEISLEPSISYSNESIHSPMSQPKPKKHHPIGVPVLGGLGSDPISRSRSVEKATASNPVDEANLPKQVQNLDLIAELQQKLKLNKGKGSSSLKHTPSTKLNKPKAPPPPPPKQQNGPAASGKVITEQPRTSAPTTKMTKTKEVSDDNRDDQPDKDAKSKNGKAEKKLELEPKKDEEFFVDASSPCRIATPKTGFDFLDNW